MNISEQRASGVLIEISGRCNAKCPYCARQRFKQRYSGDNISPVLFEQIVEHLFKLEIFDKGNSCAIGLFNWGEPFLNPGINAILQILRKKKLYADISSNFIIKPEIENENLPVISSIKFSLSGFSQESYNRIHGATLKSVLKKFDSFYKKIREHSPKTSITIAWHRYLFNEDEFWDAYRYFNRPGITFEPTVAYLNDLSEMMDFLKGRLPEERKKQAEKDLFLDHIRKGIDHCSTLSKNYHCPSWDSLVIDETGQLLLCCAVTRFDSDYVSGNILEMSANDIWKIKSNNKLCSECVSSGIAPWLFNQGLYNRKPLPSGGGLGHLKLWFRNLCIQYNRSARSKVGKMLLRLPNGMHLINALKSFEKRLNE